ADLKKWASELGYDISSSLDSGKYRSEVQKDSKDAQAAGGTGTPFFVIVGSDGKGTVLSGAQPFSAFKQLIDSKLA
ncbi:MAG: DsbA family protein, partial [Nanoarchaeota archaeon]